MKYNKKIMLGILVVLVVLLVALLVVTKIKADKKREEEYNKLVENLCNISIELAETHPNVITLDKEVGSIYNLSLKTLSLLTLGKENRVPVNLKNPKLSRDSKPIYFSDQMAIKLVVNSEKKVTCEGMIDLGEAPKITLKGEKEITLKLGDEYKEPGYTATDKEDGDLTSRVLKSGKPDVNKRGEYEIIYFLEDSSGNKTSESRKIFIK